MQRQYVLYSIVYFIQGCLGLLGVALPFFLKDILLLSTAQVAYILALASTPWVIKPLYGMVSDYFPLFGQRRRPYIIIAALLSSLGWLFIAEVQSFWVLVLGQLLANVGFAVVDVVTDGFAVEHSTRKNRGFIQSLSWGMRAFGATLSGFLGGWLIGVIGYQNIFRVVAFLPLLVVFVVWTMKEKKFARKAGLWQHMTWTIRSLFKNTQYWLVALFGFLFFVTPSISIPFLFYMRDTLGFSNTTIGILVSVASFGSVVGAVVYSKFLDRVAVRTLLCWMVLASAVFSFAIFFIKSELSAYTVYFLLGVVSYLAFIPTMKIAARVSPKAFEATSFALLMSIINLASGVLSQSLGGWLFSVLGIAPVIVIGAVTNLLALPVVRLLRD
ncbi:MAG: MFS transporter [Candidatus Woesearchaeota archaeon]|nr:MFS transporter [Candidatus Woesearchaeota archaeon]